MLNSQISSIFVKFLTIIPSKRLMKLSVIVPVYNVECYLRECIDSILRQDFTDFELILVDDGSPDRCGEICDEYAVRDHRVWVIHQANGGLSAARNAGLEMASGDCIAFIDSDDFIAPDFFSRAMQVFEERPDTDLVEMPIILRYSSADASLYGFPVPGSQQGAESIFASWVRHRGYLHTYSCNKVCRRSLFHQLRFPVGHVFEDSYITPRLLEQCRQVYYLPCDGKVPDKDASADGLRNGAYYYRHREDSITRTAGFEDFKNYLEHQLPWCEKADRHPMVTRTESCLYGLSLVNVLIDLMRTDDALQPENLPFVRETVQRLHPLRPSLKCLMQLPSPVYDKLKNLPFVLFGLPFHLLCFTGKRIKGE